MTYWRKISSKTVYSSPYFLIKEDKVLTPDGREDCYYVIDRLGAVAVVALDKDNNLYLLREEKYLHGSLWTIPAGKIEKADKNPLLAAKRELKEETGLTAKKWTDLGIFLNAPGTSTGRGYCFLAQDLKEGKQNLDPSEEIKVVKTPFTKAIEMIKKGEIIDAWAIVPIFKTKLLLNL